MVALRWLIGATSLGLVPVAMSQFNTTVNFTLTSADPMLDFDMGSSDFWPRRYPFSIDEATGYRTSVGSGNGAAGAWFVGTGFEVHGFVTNTSSLNSTRPSLAGSLMHGSGGPWDEYYGSEPGQPNKYKNFSLPLLSYKLMMRYGAGLLFEFHNFTISVPIRTQAPSFEELENQAKFTPTVRAGQLNPAMRASRVPAMTYHDDLFNKTLSKRLDISAKVVDDAIQLGSSTELFYQLPANTTLVRVFGPVGLQDATTDGSVCFAALDPLPSWWNNKTYPKSSSHKMLNGTNQTMFLLPVDPTVETKVIVGPDNENAQCWISGISTYPFHYNYTLANMITDGPEEGVRGDNNTSNGTSLPGSQNVASGGTSKTGIIIGVVVGVGGALILGGLALWLFRRHKAMKRNEEEGRRVVAPYVVSEKELYRAASWSSVNAGGSGTATNPREPRWRGSDDERPPRRILREQDAEEDFEVLPPLYREWEPRPGLDDEAAASLPAPPRPHPNAPNGAATVIAPVEPSSSLKDDYMRALSLLPGSSSGSSSQSPIAPLKEEYARTFGRDGSTQPAPVAAVASDRHPEDTKGIVHTESPSSHEQPRDQATHYAEHRPNRPPSARLSIGSIEEGGDLKEDYKRTFL